MSAKNLVMATLLTAIALTATAVQATEFVTNGDFSAGSTGWTTTSNAYFFDNSYFEGNVGGEGRLRQVITGDFAPSLLQFDFSSNSGGYQRVEFNGIDISGILAPGALTHYLFNVNGTGLDTLDFFGRNEPSYNQLSNVSLTGDNTNVPEPTTVALVGLGLLGFAASRRKSANSKNA